MSPGFGLFLALLMTLSVSSLPQVRAIGMTVSGKIFPRISVVRNGTHI